jgi:hypothetical protein
MIQGNLFAGEPLLLSSAQPRDREGIFASRNEIVSCRSFADSGHTISKSIVVLASAIVAKAVIDIGISYIVIMFCVVAVQVLLLWSVSLNKRLSQQKQMHSLDRLRMCTCRASLAHYNETIKMMQADLWGAEQRQCETRMALKKASTDLSQMQSDQEQARQKLDKALSDLDGARCTISILESESETKRNDELEQSNGLVMFLGSELAKTEGELEKAKASLVRLQAEEGPEAKRQKHENECEYIF